MDGLVFFTSCPNGLSCPPSDANCVLVYAALYSFGFTYSGRFGFFSLYFFVITFASTDFFTGDSKSLTLTVTGFLPLLLVPDVASGNLVLLDSF